MSFSRGRLCLANLRVRRRVLLGSVSSLSERAAWKLLQPYLDRVNAAAKLPPKSGITLDVFREGVASECRGEFEE
jgi:hypothetical protein